MGVVRRGNAVYALKQVERGAACSPLDRLSVHRANDGMPDPFLLQFRRARPHIYFERRLVFDRFEAISPAPVIWVLPEKLVV
jgi:hypothetical protein